MMQSRTHNCGELRLSHAGEKVTIVGWLENVREVGSNFAFCVVRDFYGKNGHFGAYTLITPMGKDHIRVLLLNTEI